MEAFFMLLFSGFVFLCFIAYPVTCVLGFFNNLHKEMNK